MGARFQRARSRHVENVPPQPAESALTWVRRLVSSSPDPIVEAETVMRRPYLVLAALAALAPLGGCAASGNLFAKDKCKVYGGTQVDAALIADAAGRR